MRVLLINATYGSGSTGVIVKDIQETCLDNGIECRTAYAFFNSNSPNSFNGYKIGSRLENKIHALLSRIYGKSGYYSFLSTLNLIRKIDEYKPDVINIHNLHSNFVNLNLLLEAIAKRDIPLVVTLHDCWYFTGGCFHFTNAGCSKWLSDCKKCPKKKLDTPAYFRDCASQILRDRYRYFSKIPRLYVVGVSEWITSLAKKTVFKNANCYSIHNGVDPAIFKPRKSDLKTKLGLEDKQIILGPASKWLDPVNSDLLIALSNNLTDQQVLLLFGCNDNVKIELPHVKTFGFTHNKVELSELYSIADVFVNCSREDTLSLINIEAQACGTPLITYDNTGLKETPNPNFSSCVRTGDISGILEALRNAPRKNEYISDTLSQWVYSNFNKNVNYDKYVELFKRFGSKE